MSAPDIVKRCYLIVKRGLYFRPDDCGYTGLKKEAGRYHASHASSDCGETAIHEDVAPDYAPAYSMEARLADKDATITALRAEVDRKDVAMERAIMLIERNLYRQSEKVEDAKNILRAALERAKP